jgi:hypothetical protein
MFRVRKSFFGSIKKYIHDSILHEMNQKQDIDDTMDGDEDISDELMSAIYDDEDQTSNHEDILSMMLSSMMESSADVHDVSAVTERMMNFYLGLVGSSTIARGDSMEMRLLGGNIIHTITQSILTTRYNELTIDFFGTLMLHYGKNAYLYTYISEKIRTAKGEFSLPLYAGTKSDNYSHITGINLMTSGHIGTLLQDINEDMISISINHTDLLATYDHLFAKKIARIAKKSSLDSLIPIMR